MSKDSGLPLAALAVDGGMAQNSLLMAFQADLLKVGHHGSAYSSSPAFIAAVRPRVALISVGRHNLFGHPAATTLATLRDAGTIVYRTDLCGAIVVEAETSVRASTTLRC